MEEVVYASGLISEVAAIGIPHPRLGQAIVLVVVCGDDQALDEKGLTKFCQQQLPAYMVPASVIEKERLARNPNGKIDRKVLAEEYKNLFSETGESA